jgi:hypothetical protein
MSELLAAVLAVLRRYGMPYTVIEDREIAETRWGGGRSRVTMRCIADARSDRPMLLCYSTPEERVPESRRAAVAAYLNRVNCVTWIGSFELVHETGEVRLRTAVDFGLQRPTEGLIEPAAILNISGINARLPLIRDVIDGDDEAGTNYVAYR